MHSARVCVRRVQWPAVSVRGPRGSGGRRMSGVGDKSDAWVLWNAIEGMREVDKVLVSKFIKGLRDLVMHTHSSTEAQSSELERRMSPVIEIARTYDDSTDFTVSEPMSAHEARDLLTYFETGGMLSLKHVQRITEQAKEVLGREQAITTIEKTPPNGRVIVVGDVHGSFGDLLEIIRRYGKPTPLNRFVFNGDLVDRGLHSFEVFMCIMALKVAFPTCVYVNRGNHEDEDLSWSYDLAMELDKKFGHDGAREVLHMFGDVFSVMPFGVVLPTQTIILHAGVPRSLATIDEINAIPRSVDDPHMRTLCGDAKDDAHQSLQDIVWSDPEGNMEHAFSHVFANRSPDLPMPINFKRGDIGVLYDAQRTMKWLYTHNLRRLVRSHEMVSDGAVLSKGTYSLSDIHRRQKDVTSSDDVAMEHWTVFSSSCYPNGQGMNEAAVLIIPSNDSITTDANEGTHMNRNAYAERWVVEPYDKRLSMMAFNRERLHQTTADAPAAQASPDGHGGDHSHEFVHSNVVVLLTRHRNALMNGWKAMERSDGKVSVKDWARVLSEVVHGSEERVWLKLLPMMGGTVASHPDVVNFRQQLRIMKKSFDDSRGEGHRQSSSHHSAASVFAAALYRDPAMVSNMFNLVDEDRNGTISFDELKTIVDRINAHRFSKTSSPSTFVPLDAELLWPILDKDLSGSIDLNEFAESTRIGNLPAPEAQQQLTK